MAEEALTCPICAAAAREETAPFCSERCRQVDLHNWLSGAYQPPHLLDEEDFLQPDAE